MSSTVTVDENQVLYAIHEYLQQAKRANCLAAFERNSYPSETLKSVLPSDLSVLRVLCLNGNWKEIGKYLEVFEDKDGFKQCQHEVLKQQYLELLSSQLTLDSDEPLTILEGHSIEKLSNTQKERLNALQNLLSKLKKLSPTKEEYSILVSLAELPTPEVNPEYASWSVSLGRLNCFHKISSWLSRVLCLDLDHLFPSVNSDPSQAHTSDTSSRLVQLLAKGLLYEKCESACTSRCGEARSASGLEMLDVCSWIQQQPDSAFQLSPSRLTLGVKPCSLNPTSETILHQVTQSLSINLPVSTTTSSSTVVSQKTGVCAMSRSDPEIHQLSTTERKDVIDTHIRADSPKAKYPPIDKKKQSEEAVFSGNALVHNDVHAIQTRDTFQIKEVGEHPKIDVSVSKKYSGTQIRQEDSTRHGIGVFEEFEDRFVSSPVNKAKSNFKTCRNSSTPKPSRDKVYLPPSPQTSPVLHAAHSHGGPKESVWIRDTEEAYRGQGANLGERELSMPRKNLSVSETIEKSIDWPVVTLLSQVKDSQAVRSVAFSQSGAVVAIGANSRTIRLCSTAPLLEGVTSDDLAEFYHHPSYHKGSIYCLAWRGDTILASGSNDQKIRLLTYDPDKADSPCKFMGEMNFHKGTIRDIVFTPEGRLVSGGAGNPVVVISDCFRKQVVSSLSGHTDQVLALAIIQENVILSGSQDKTIKLWDARQRKPFHTFTTDHPTTSLSVSRSGNEILSAHTDGSCCVHSLSMLNKLATYNPHTDECRNAKYCPQYDKAEKGQWIVSVSYDGTVCLADSVSLEWQQIGEHSDKVVQCRWHCGGKVFATTGADKKACFWLLN